LEFPVSFSPHWTSSLLSSTGDTKVPDERKGASFLLGVVCSRYPLVRMTRGFSFFAKVTLFFRSGGIPRRPPHLPLPLRAYCLLLSGNLFFRSYELFAVPLNHPHSRVFFFPAKPPSFHEPRLFLFFPLSVTVMSFFFSPVIKTPGLLLDPILPPLEIGHKIRASFSSVWECPFSFGWRSLPFQVFERWSSSLFQNAPSFR